MAHVILLASDHLAVRILEQLRRDGVRITVVAPEGSWLARAILPSDIASVIVDPARLRMEAIADITTADALLAVSEQDELNLGAALEALELSATIRVVIRQFNLRLGRLLSEHLPRSQIMSLSALAAPSFALAALTPGVVFAHSFGRETLVFRVTAEDAAGSVVARSRTDALIASSERGLTRHTESARRVPPADREAKPTNRLLVWTLAYIAFAVIVAAAFFVGHLHLGVVDAFYFVVTTVTSVGFGDFSLRETDTVSKLVGVWLMISGVMSMAVLFAVLTNDLFDRQHAFERGQVRARLRDHVVVCGLGVIGFRVAQTLQRLGQRVVVIEADEDGRFVAQARAEGIPVIVGDATQERTLRYANAARARALLVCTNPDFVNLEIALNARSLLGDIPLVVRFFDPELASRVTTHFDLGATFSSATLGAVSFAAAATGSTRLAVLHFDGRSFEVHLLVVGDGEIEDGDSPATCRKRLPGARPIAVAERSGALVFDVDDERRLQAGDVLVMVTP